MADRRLQVFRAVARHLSFTRAADALFMTQPAVTFQVRQLEEQYGTRLFDRRHGSIALTPAGELALSYAERILGLADEMDTRIGEMTDEMRGLLQIGVSASLGELLPRVLAEFAVGHPQVRVQLSVANSEAIARRVADHSLDVGLIAAPAKLPNLSCTICGADELMLICAPEHPLAGLAKISAKVLVGHEYVCSEPGSGTREIVDAYLRANRVAVDDLQIRMELGSPEALKGAVAAGAGFAIVARDLASREVRLGELVAIPLQPRLRRSRHLVVPEDRFRSRLAATFIQFAGQKLAELAS